MASQPSWRYSSTGESENHWRRGVDAIIICRVLESPLHPHPRQTHISHFQPLLFRLRASHLSPSSSARADNHPRRFFLTYDATCIHPAPTPFANTGALGVRLLRASTYTHTETTFARVYYMTVQRRGRGG